ncbi:MAG TPA: hypothetical protein VK897_24975 [Anaerolineales bacterium]|nr:hypothetical protein [Anaerolineales bacterium]
MDPITLIVSALTAGATAALQETAGTAIKDAYQGLIALVKQKFSKDPKAVTALDGDAEDLDTWQKALEKSIRETGAAEDEQILLAAQNLLKLLQSQESTPKYNVEITGDVQGFVQGDHTNVTMNFDKPSPKPKKRKK